ncbi:MAG TPA: hypothetical protein VK492_01070 [Chitinophagaceae bacterium]|nr:hypothetical protein [Chitinophagaceae bacterium]
MRLKLFVMLCTIILFCDAKSQKSTFNNNLESAINYLSTNRDLLATKWLSMVNNNSGNYYKYDQILKDGMKFRISDTFYIRGISYFKDTLSFYGDSVDISTAEILNPNLYSKYDSYKPSRDSLFDDLIRQKGLNLSADFIIGFSKPIKDFIVCELWYKEFGQGYRAKFGDSIIILFLFNRDSSIRKIYFKRIIK